MNELLLSFIWKQRLISPNTFTTDKSKVYIVYPGLENSNQGPDFLNARVYIDNNLWYGNVEIHVKSSDWFLHCHQLDINFQNVICHVVWICDTDVYTSNGEKIPTIELSTQILPELINNYQFLMDSRNPIPCAKLISDVHSFIIYDMLESCFVEMLNNKIASLHLNLQQLNNNIDEFSYRTIARAFGFKVNNDPFEETAKALPFSLIRRYINDLELIEALLFGQANLLHDHFSDAYPKNLHINYSFYKKKHSLKPQISSNWRYLRLHPGNFPCIRIAQFASFLYNNFTGIDIFLSMRKIEQIYDVIIKPINEYWDYHFKFDIQSTYKRKIMGKNSADIIIINAIVPLMYLCGKNRNLSSLSNLAIDIMEQISAEDNKIIRLWRSLNVKPLNAVHSQALIYLKNNYCDKYNCLNCKIGSKIIRSN